MVLVVEHRDGLARFGWSTWTRALAAHGRRLVVTGPGETTGDLVREMVEALTLVCARVFGRRGARDRAVRALTAARNADAGAAA